MAVRKHDRLRDVLAQEAAKIIATEGVRDYQQAKRKACERIGNSHYGSLPSNFEIERAISSFHKTFLLNHDVILKDLRNIALTIMKWFAQFSPYLVGPVLDGTANASTPISIHVSCDAVEEVVEIVQSREIDSRIEERRFKLSNDFYYLPTLIFCYQDCELAVTIFTLRQQHQHPKSKSQNRTMQRMNINALVNLLKQTSPSDRLDLIP